MNRKHLPLVVSLLALLMVAAACPLLPAASPTATATPTSTATATAVQQTDTPAPTPTKTPVPATSIPAATNTPEPPTATATQTGTPTEAPPLAPIADACKLLDTKLAGTLLGQPMVKTQNSTVKGSWTTCYTFSANASTGATLAVAQDNIAVDLHVNGYAMIDAVKACAMPVPVSAAVVKQQHDAFDKLGLTGNKLVREAYTRGYKLIQDKGCTDKYSVQAVTGLGDAAYADHIWGYEELGTVYRNTVIYINVYFKGITNAQAMDIEQKLLTPAVQSLQSQ